MAQHESRTILITGGAGFIGSNLAERLLAAPETQVRILDNLSRSGVSHNLKWLESLPGSHRLEFIEDDVRDQAAVARAARDVSEIYHLAAQVAVTTSIEDPREDLEVNVTGTFNVLEAARLSGCRPFVLYTSTNKVYGSLAGVPTVVRGQRYEALAPGFNGVNEAEPLDFHSPYGCSKGAADQYVRDYARIYDLPTVVLRMSCIAGPRQFGTEDQGWVAHFLYSVLERKPITIYGDGLQVRDILHVYDLLDAIEALRLLAHTDVRRAAGQVFNMGGGVARAVSVVEMLSAIATETGIDPVLRYRETRPGDQPLYISDIAKLLRQTGWQPRRSMRDTLASIHSFWLENHALVAGEREACMLQELVVKASA